MIRRLLAFIVVVGLTASVSAQPITDYFDATFDYAGGLVSGGGSGYNGGHWYQYPSGWWNQWFYDHPYDPDRWKEIHIEFDAAPLDPSLDLYLEFAVNWSTPEWSALGYGDTLPPTPEFDENLYIERDTLLETDFFFEPYPEHFVFDYIIPYYNPEWVSIDIRGWNFVITNGVIIHDCVPAPGALALLGLAGLVRRRRR